ncbi:protein unc-93 homolog B1 isoform X2 [Budorcas taxicolor]|uniref:protein unc-93 homolog B1 isoform X2 n=1 Tax=Budorcas taxicolor TaxID=37181 RepID=UPI0022845783|nr:protein unc-93 homolog B1 isoform X2 [Budorcas taxicolor]
MEAEPPLYPVAGAAGPQGDEERLGVPDGPEAPLDELVGAYPNYNEEEEERRYYRRKRLGVLKNVLAASAGGMLTYGVYLGLLQMQLILHYDETYREVKYGNMGLPDIDSKMLMGINVTPIAALLYTPVLIRFFGTKWMMFLAVGIYALFVSTNYWERYYTLVPSAVALGMAIVPLWASMGNYITRMAQKYYEYSHYKEQDEQGPQQRPPRGSHAPYLLVFQAIFYSFFHLSFACAQLPMIYFLNHYLYDLNHTLYNVQNCGTNSQGILLGFNKTVLRTLPRSRNLIVVESVLMAVAFLAMLLGSRLPAPSLPAWPAGAGPVRSRIPTHGGDRPAQCGLGQHLPAALQARARLPPAPPRALFHLQRLRGALCLHWSRTGLRRVLGGAGTPGIPPRGLQPGRLGLLGPGPAGAVAAAPGAPGGRGWTAPAAHSQPLLLGPQAPDPAAHLDPLHRSRALGRGQCPQQDWDQHAPGNPVRGQGKARLHLHHLSLVAGCGHLHRLPGLKPAHEG